MKPGFHAGLRLVAKNTGIGWLTDLSRDGKRGALWQMVSRSDNNMYLLEMANDAGGVGPVTSLAAIAGQPMIAHYHTDGNGGTGVYLAHRGPGGEPPESTRGPLPHGRLTSPSSTRCSEPPLRGELTTARW